MSKLIKPAGLLAGLLMLALLAGCAPSSTQYVPLPQQLNAAPAPGKARICVIRGYVFFLASGVENKILEEGQPRGTLINGSYICWERPPGVAQIAMGEGDDIYYRGNLPVEADLIYYLYMDAVSTLRSIPPAEGQKYLAEYPTPQVEAGAALQPASTGQAAPEGPPAHAIGVQGGGPAPPANKRVNY